MRRSFSVEDLLDEVEKICYDASGTSKVRNKFSSLNLQSNLEKCTVQLSHESINLT